MLKPSPRPWNARTCASCRSRQMTNSTCKLSIACVTGSWREELFTNGFTNWAGINFTSWPCSRKARPQEVRPRTCFHPDQAGLQVRGEGNQLLLGKLLLQQHLAVIAKRHQVKGRLTKVQANALLVPYLEQGELRGQFNQRGTPSEVPDQPSCLGGGGELGRSGGHVTKRKVMFSIVDPDSDNELRPVQKWRIL